MWTPFSQPKHPKRLFKYIRFDDSGYWSQPLTQGTLYFSTFDELRAVNDKDEFAPSWSTTSHFLTRNFHHIKDSYDRLFSNSRVLCAGRALHRSSWDAFCIGGGVCYEFSYDVAAKASDIN